MNLFFRLLWISIVSRFRKPVSVFGPCVTPFRCLPSDLDVLRHMNNGKYFSIMDLARVDLMIRAGVAQKISEKGWYPVVVAESMRFQKSLQPFESFSVETSILGWDEKAFILRQRFLKNEVSVAEAVVRARFLKKTGGSVRPEELLSLVGAPSVSPEIEGWIKNWNQSQI